VKIAILDCFTVFLKVAAMKAQEKSGLQHQIDETGNQFATVSVLCGSRGD
jgi:hypothetical protein